MHTHTQMHTQMRAHTHTNARTRTHTNARTHTQNVRTHTHTHKCAHTHTNARTHTHKSAQAHAHAHTHTRTHAHTRARAHALTHARTHAHARNYPNAIVIFEGYGSGPSRKDMTHQRRSGQVMSPVINFTGNMALSFSKDKFLSNDTNKQNIINLIGKILQIAGYNVLFKTKRLSIVVSKR